jgi:hypothetical protein
LDDVTDVFLKMWPVPGSERSRAEAEGAARPEREDIADDRHHCMRSIGRAT